MKKYYRVTEKVFDDGKIDAFISTVEADEMPENEFHSTELADIYYLYFGTLEVAEEFKRHVLSRSA